VIRRRLTFANVTSCIALFVALGGTSYALTRLPSNSVGTVQIRNRAVTPAKLAVSALSRGPLGPQGPAGADGPIGATGPAGPTGPQGPSNGYLDAGAGGALPANNANIRVTEAQLTSLPAGDYILTGMADFGDFNNGGEVAQCDITVNGTEVAYGSGVLGNGQGSTRAFVVSEQGATSQPAAFTAALNCWSNTALAQPPGVGNPTLAAIALDNVTVTP
jgi:hypothetical protein